MADVANRNRKRIRLAIAIAVVTLGLLYGACWGIGRVIDAYLFSGHTLNAEQDCTASPLTLADVERLTELEFPPGARIVFSTYAKWMDAFAHAEVNVPTDDVPVILNSPNVLAGSTSTTKKFIDQSHASKCWDLDAITEFTSCEFTTPQNEVVRLLIHPVSESESAIYIIYFEV